MKVSKTFRCTLRTVVLELLKKSHFAEKKSREDLVL